MRSYSSIVFLVVACSPLSTAFQAARIIRRTDIATRTIRKAVLVDSVEQSLPSLTVPSKTNDENVQYNGAMPIDLSGIALSGLKGQALSNIGMQFPTAFEVRSAIPADCFEPDTIRSLGYLSVSLISTALCTAVGVNLLSVLSPANPLTWPIWLMYSVVTGTVAMGLWVLAHECGHGAFSQNKKLQDAVGFTFHSIMLVPYFSWQRSHAVHHQYTNHMELGETHVPEKLKENDEDSSYSFRQSLINIFGKERGLQISAVQQSIVHLVFGWPAYLLIGATGGPARGMTNHFYPEPLSTPDQPNKELFPGNWKTKVYQSDIGVAAVVGALVAWTAASGFANVMALYGGPLLIVNAWLVLYTWLQHTDVDVPHFGADNHNYVKGALHTIDRPYDKLDPWGIIDFLHHKIGSTHVAHHFDSSIPHYKAQAATDAIKEKFPDFYLYDPTPIPQALWRVCKGCVAVEKKGDAWVWKNDGIEDVVEGKNL